jgi:hypothetical protein
MLDDITGEGPWLSEPHRRLIAMWLRSRESRFYSLTAIVADELSFAKRIPLVEEDHYHSVVCCYSGNNCEECSVCLLPLDNVCQILDCGHRFHSTCVNEWIRRCEEQYFLSVTCPLCRRMHRCRYRYRHRMMRQHEEEMSYEMSYYSIYDAIYSSFLRNSYHR